MIKCAHITSVHRPFDTRIFHKECKSLAESGYEVVLIAAHDKSETVDGVRIHAIQKPANRLNRLTRTIWTVYRAALEENAHIYHLHDPELLPVGLLLKLKGREVIYDVHEDYSASVKQKRYLPRWFGLILSTILSFIEPILARPMQIVIAERYYQRRFVDSTPVLNYPILHEFGNDFEYRGSGSLHLLYTGTVGVDRGALIYAQLVRHFPELEITLIGRCSESLAERMQQIAGNPITAFTSSSKYLYWVAPP